MTSSKSKHLFSYEFEITFLWRMLEHKTINCVYLADLMLPIAKKSSFYIPSGLND